MPGTHSKGTSSNHPLAAGRRVLWVGFGAILLLMALTGIDASLSEERATARNTDLVRSFRGRDQVLDEMRNLVIRSGTLIRDYLSERDPAKAGAERNELESSRKRIAELLDSYSAQGSRMSPIERQIFDGLKDGMEAYWNSLSPPLAWDAAEKAKKGDSYREDVILPLRTEVLGLSREITKLNDEQLDAGERSIQEEQDKLGDRLIVASTLGIVIACFLAGFVSFRIRRLEAAAQTQLDRVAHAHDELRALAAQLESAQEEERKRVSRELHDEVGQSMSALLVELGRLEADLPPGDAAASRLAAVRKRAEASVRSVRDMALLLRPSMLDDLGLVAALKWQGREISRTTGMSVEIDAEDAGDELPDSHRTCVYRIVQEALRNCARHADASSVRVVLKQSPGALDVAIQDDGRGFDPATEEGLGLLGMEERVGRLGGVLRVDSREGHGSVISIHLPAPQMGAA
jgi:signal transduction histidine kinase